MQSSAFFLPASRSAAGDAAIIAADIAVTQRTSIQNPRRITVLAPYFNTKLRPPVAGRSQPFDCLVLLLVADAIDRTRPVVGHEDRAILVEDNVVGTAEIALVAFDPAGCEHGFLGVLAVRIGGDADDTCALIFMPIP